MGGYIGGKGPVQQSGRQPVMLGQDFDALKDMEENKKAFPLFFEPSSIDARIVNQYALFS